MAGSESESNLGRQVLDRRVSPSPPVSHQTPVGWRENLRRTLTTLSGLTPSTAQATPIATTPGPGTSLQAGDPKVKAAVRPSPQHSPSPQGAARGQLPALPPNDLGPHGATLNNASWVSQESKAFPEIARHFGNPVKPPTFHQPFLRLGCSSSKCLLSFCLAGFSES